MYQTISHYRALERLDSGGEGYVCKAQDLRLNRLVAIKCLQPNLERDDQAIERLRREAQNAASLTHPHIATVYEVVDSGDQFYIVMEFVEGETLKSRIDRGPLDISASLAVAVQVAEALSAAHARGLIHSDIKPSNIMITCDGQVKVLDFGLARIAASSIADPSRNVLCNGSRSGWLERSIGGEGDGSSKSVSGTPGYMSPEQVRGEVLDQRTDIFSVGVVLYEMLTTETPFGGAGSREVFRAVLNDEPRSLGALCADAPLELERIVRRALAKRPEERYQSAEDLLRDLGALKERLEDEEKFKARYLSNSATESEVEDAGNIQRRLATLRSLAVRQRGWLLLAGVLAASVGVWDIVSFHPQGAEWSRVAGLLAVTAVCMLSYLAARRGSVVTLKTNPAGSAFRGLLPFQEADRDRFYGRETDAAALVEMIRHSDYRFGVLFGESGCGKTSLLRAGLLPSLWEAGYVPVYCRSYKDPLAAALDEFRKRSHINPIQAEPARPYFARAARELATTVVIVCDQFEEFFVSHKSREERESFLSFVAACHDDRDLPLKFLVSMRSDFLYLISSELGGRIAEPLISSRLFHLRNFNEAQANEIIEKSARRAGIPFEEGLSRQVARDLATGGVVSPSELQIVGEQLQSKRIYSLQGYRRAGGKEPLVHGFLEDVIRASGDADGARLLLRSIISDENTRLTLTVEDIAKRTQRNQSSVARLLTQFVGARLVREIQEDEPWRYELMHEYLIEKINHITGKVMDATQRANRLLRQYASNYSVDGRTRIPVGMLWFIRRYSDVALGERERDLLKKSLRWGLVKSSMLTLLLAGGAVMATAALSVSDEWVGVRLSDGHTAAARKAVFSPDGRLVVSSGEDGRVIVWDFERRQRLAVFDDNDGWVSSVAFSPDGKWFATPGPDNTVSVWDTARLEKSVVLRGHTTPVSIVAFSGDGSWLASASGSPGGYVSVWDTARWEQRYVLKRSVMWGDLVFSPNCRRLMIAGEIWDLQSASRIGVVDAVYVTFLPNGRAMVGVDGTGAVIFCDTRSTWDDGQARVMRSQRVHSYHGRAVASSPDGNLVASGAEDIVLWDATSQTKLARLKHAAQVWSLAFSPDGRWLISTHDDGAVLLWDVAEREQLASFNGHSGSVHSVAFSPDGRLVASTSEDRSVIVWNPQNNRKEATLTGFTNRVTAATFSQDGGLLAACDMDSNIVLWHASDWKARWTTRYLFRGNWQATYCLAFSPDARYLACTSGVFDVRDHRHFPDFNDLCGIYRIPWGQTYGVGFSPDGKRLACVTDQGYLLLWDVEKWELGEYVHPGDTPLITLSFSPNGKQLITGDDNGVVRLWDVNPLREIAVVGQHGARIKSVVFSPDGREAASSGDDQTIALWDVGARRLVTHLGTHTSPVLSIAFSPDGKRLVSGDYDSSVRMHIRHRTLWGYKF